MKKNFTPSLAAAAIRLSAIPEKCSRIKLAIQVQFTEKRSVYSGSLHMVTFIERSEEAAELSIYLQETEHLIAAADNVNTLIVQKKYEQSGLSAIMAAKGCLKVASNTYKSFA